MRWKVATPFTRSGSGWIMAHIPAEQHTFDFVPARYQHDRSRQTSSGTDWLDYFFQALSAWMSACLAGKSVGFITAFPQLPLILGLFKRMTGSKRPLLAWCFNLGRTYGGIKGRVAKFALCGVDAFVVHSRKEIATYSAWLGLPESRFVFVPLSIALRDANFDEETKTPFIVAMGSANRDYRLFVKAVEMLGYSTIIIAGPHAVFQKLPENVRILSGLSLEECHEFCQKAALNVIPVNAVETASGQVTLLETMMYGKAVVATRCVGTSDYITDGVNGILIPAKNLDAMVGAIKKLWENAALRHELGCSAKKYVHEHATFQAAVVPMVSILDELERKFVESRWNRREGDRA